MARIARALERLVDLKEEEMGLHSPEPKVRETKPIVYSSTLDFNRKWKETSTWQEESTKLRF